MALPEIKLRISADTSDLDKGLSASEQNTKRVSGRMSAAIGGIGGSLRRASIAAAGLAVAIGGAAAGLTKMVSATARSGDQIAKTSRKLGIAAERLQELQFAAEKSGVNVRTMETALQRMSRRVAEAAKGSGEAKDTIAALGLDAEKLAALAPDEMLAQFADAIGQLEGGSEKIATAFKIFDSEGVAMLQMLEGGSEGLAAMAAEAQEVGNILDGDTLAASERFRDEVQRLQESFGALKNDLMAELIPLFADVLIPTLTEKVIPAFRNVGEAIGQIIEWVQSLINKFQELIDRARSVVEALRNTFSVGQGRHIGGAGPMPPAAVNASPPPGMIGPPPPPGMRAAGGPVIKGRPYVVGETGRELFIPNTSGTIMNAANTNTAGGTSDGGKGFFGGLIAMFRRVGGDMGAALASGLEESQGLVKDATAQVGRSAVEETGNMVSGVLGALGQLFDGSKAIAAAEAIVNTMVGITQALRLPFPQSLAAAAKVALEGAAALKQIQQARPGGGQSINRSGGGGPVAGPAPLEVRMTGLRAGELIDGGDVGALLDRLSDEAGDRGLRLMVAA